MNISSVDWLLDSSDPALSAKVLTDLLDRPEDDPEVVDARSRIQEMPWVKETLKAFETGEVWDLGFYIKYRGPSWSLAHLMNIGLPGDHPVMQKGAEYILEQAKPLSSLKPGSREAERYEGKPDGTCWLYPLSCLSARMAMVLTHAGYGLHEVARGARSQCISAFRPGVGFDCMAIDLSLIPGCVMAVPEVLKAMIAIPEADRSKEERRFIGEAISLLMQHEIYKYVVVATKEWNELTYKEPFDWVLDQKRDWLAAGRADERTAKPSWLRFHYPHGYNPDLIEVLNTLADAGVKRSPEIDAALEQVLAKRTKDGYLKMTGGLNGKMWADLEQKGKPSRWVTYRALRALKGFGLTEIEA
ncbi:hypothetical protein KQI63_00020 [bacterium]|nr:hypothetical protein [bacterium]